MYARSIDLEVHISTQVNITNIEAVKFYAQFADVVVLAREMNLGRVTEIYNQIVEQQVKGPSGKLVRLEMFVHGALCMAVSGKCYLSLHEMNSSANRGSCLQTCRRAYIVTDKETGAELEIDNEYIMSPKDLKTIHFLNKILDAGVSVLKIEGRARSAEYVKTTVECYHEAVEAYLEVILQKKKWLYGMRNFQLYLTGVSGTDIILASGWENGVAIMVLLQQKGKFILESAPTILIIYRLQNLNWRHRI
jgi:U32 family peptidase